MMRKIILLFVMITLALGVFAQSKGKNAMTLRLVDIKVTDGALVNIAKDTLLITNKSFTANSNNLFIIKEYC